VADPAAVQANRVPLFLHAQAFEYG